MTRPTIPDHHRRAYRVREFLRRLWDKSAEDDIFFMAGSIAFNVMVALLPLLILGIGVTGYVLSARFGDPTEEVLGLLAGGFSPAFKRDACADLLGQLQEHFAQVLDHEAAKQHRGGSKQQKHASEKCRSYAWLPHSQGVESPGGQPDD